MVTRDHLITPQAIVKEVGIISPNKNLIIYDTDTPIPSSHQTGVSACVPGYVMVDWKKEILDKVITGYL